MEETRKRKKKEREGPIGESVEWTCEGKEEKKGKEKGKKTVRPSERMDGIVV